MKKTKKSMIILFSILAVIGITVGGCSMHQYQKKQEMIAIATSDEARKVYEEYLKKEDPKALTEEGIIKSYEIDKENNTIHSVLKNGKLDTANQTIIFPEAINIVQLATMSIGPVAKETTYKYSIDGDILTLTIEQSDAKNNVNTIISAKFKKVAE